MGADVVGMGGQGGTPWFWWRFAIVVGGIHHAVAGGGLSQVEGLARGLRLERGSWGDKWCNDKLASAVGISSWLSKQLNSASLAVGLY